MLFINFTDNNCFAEICLTRKEMLAVFTAFSNIQFGFRPDVHELFFNVTRQDIQKLCEEFRQIQNNINENTNNINDEMFIFKKYINEKDQLYFLVDYIGLKTIIGALSHTTTSVCPDDCPFTMGVEWNDILEAKSQIFDMLVQTV